MGSCCGYQDASECAAASKKTAWKVGTIVSFFPAAAGGPILGAMVAERNFPGNNAALVSGIFIGGAISLTIWGVGVLATYFNCIRSTGSEEASCNDSSEERKRLIGGSHINSTV